MQSSWHASLPQTTFFLLATSLATTLAAQVSQVNISGPPGTSFGSSVEVLSNGNVVVVAPEGVGGVYLYSGSGALISTLSGSTPGDFSATRIVLLSSGDFIVASPFWNNTGLGHAGAVTWVDGRSGRSGTVSAGNSLVGTHAEDLVGEIVKPLSNGGYVVVTPHWDLDATNIDAGSTTWVRAGSAITGTISSTNSLIGSSRNDGSALDDNSVVELANHNVVVANTSWNNGMGAVTWLDGTTGQPVGAISAVTSLVGGSDQDGAGAQIVALDDGSYVVDMPFWDDPLAIPVTNAGAVTWCKGISGGCRGKVTKASSLYGALDGADIGIGGIVPLAGGHYMVLSPDDAGRVGSFTWLAGGAPFSGSPASAQSFYGQSGGDQVGSGGYTMLSDHNVVIQSPKWHTGGNSAGAVTWIRAVDGAGAGGEKSGFITAANSFVSSFDNDRFGQRVVALTNGNYVVACQSCDSTSGIDVGVAAFGTNSTVGVRSAANSVFGGTVSDAVGTGVVPLTNGNYVVVSPNWNFAGNTPGVGAVTWVDGLSGRPSDGNGMVGFTNSLVGRTQGDNIGLFGVTALSNGNYVVLSPTWSATTTLTNAGAVTWGSGASGISGDISPLNSFLGDKNDLLGIYALALPNGSYVVSSPSWDGDKGAATFALGDRPLTETLTKANSLVSDFGVNAGSEISLLPSGDYVVQSRNFCAGPNCVVTGAGAITLGRVKGGGISGVIDATNSVIGTMPGGGARMVYRYNCRTRQLIVGRPAEDLVTFFNDHPDQLFTDGFESDGACR